MKVLIVLGAIIFFVYACFLVLNHLANRKTKVAENLAYPDQKPLAITIIRPRTFFSFSSTVDYTKNLQTGEEKVYLFYFHSKHSLFVTYEPSKGITKVHEIGRAYLSKSSYDDKWRISYEGLSEFMEIEESNPLVQDLLKKGEELLNFARKRTSKALAKIEKKISK
jgi:hypothetical protein